MQAQNRISIWPCGCLTRSRLAASITSENWSRPESHWPACWVATSIWSRCQRGGPPCNTPSSGMAFVPSERPALRVADILENIDLIQVYAGGMDWPAFQADRMRRDAIERCLQRISEAAVKLG